MKPLISVIIPTYNRLSTLPRALASVSQQTLQAIELIIVDDGSDDGTRDWVQRHYPHAIYTYQNNQGVSSARNHGIQSAEANWIALLDSDDAWHPHKLQCQWDALSAHPQTLLCHTDETWYRNQQFVNPKQKHQKFGGMIFEKCLALCAISPSSVLIKKSLFAEVGLFDESLPACEDYDLWLRITCQHAVLYLPERLTIKYGGHSDQLSAKYWGMDRFRIRALLKVIVSGQLNPRQQHQARAVLHEKCSILKKGAIKHNNQQLLQELAQICDANPVKIVNRAVTS